MPLGPMENLDAWNLCSNHLRPTVIGLRAEYCGWPSDGGQAVGWGWGWEWVVDNWNVVE